jgi:Protein of unknown function (DUF4242)
MVATRGGPERRRSTPMPTFLIERNLPGASNLTGEELKAIARTSNAVVDNLGVTCTWQRRYVAGDKIYCVREAESSDDVYEHARRGGLTADLIVEIPAVIGPDTAEDCAVTSHRDSGLDLCPVRDIWVARATLSDLAYASALSRPFTLRSRRVRTRCVHSSHNVCRPKS